MTDEMTLADRVLQATIAKRSLLGVVAERPLHEFRDAILKARRFVLDKSMSSFLGDLAHTIKNTAAKEDLFNSMRRSAMLPHAVTWIEFDGVAFNKRLKQLGAQIIANPSILGDPDDVSPRVGMLMERHPRLPTVTRLTEFLMDDDEDSEAVAMPFSFVWNAADEPLPHSNLCYHSGMLGHGVMGYVTPHVGAIMPVKDTNKKHWQTVRMPDGTTFKTHYLITETCGVVRYAMAFLAALNDMPSIHTEMTPTKRWYARGQYKKFLDHSVIRLNLPASKDTIKVARRLITNIHRRAHEVRGHWRLYERKADLECSHVWSAIADDDRSRCSCCPSWRTWIAEHQRGDASVGFVTHSYSVGHKVPA